MSGVAPDRRSNEVLGFMAGGSRKANFDNILPLTPATHSVYGGVNILDGGYALCGNPLDPGLIKPPHPVGTAAALHFDLINGGPGLFGLGDMLISAIASGRGTVSKVIGNTGNLTLDVLDVTPPAGEPQPLNAGGAPDRAMPRFRVAPARRGQHVRPAAETPGGAMQPLSPGGTEQRGSADANRLRVPASQPADPAAAGRHL